MPLPMVGEVELDTFEFPSSPIHAMILKSEEHSQSWEIFLPISIKLAK